jgi:DNA-binding transcriptional LysR family regulator
MSRSQLGDPWQGVEPRHLAVLAAVARERSFRGAALRLGYVQSAISQHIAFLERQVGVTLVERSRGPRPLCLTAAGQVMVGHAERILAQLRAAEADIAATATGGPRGARIGVDPSISRHILPRFLAELRPLVPDATIVPLAIAGEEQRSRLVESGELDAAFVDVPASGARLSTMELLRDPLVLLVPAGSPIAALGRAPTRDEVLDTHLLGRSKARVIGAPPEARIDVPCDSTVQALVAAGHGTAVLSRLCLDELAGTVAIALDHLVSPRVLGMCWQGDRRVDDVIEGLRHAARRSVSAAAERSGAGSVIARGDHGEQTP